jgi:hypothetical protein
LELFLVEEVSMLPMCAAADFEPMVFAMPGWRECAKRMMTMMGLWTVFGIIVGSNLLGGNLIGIISGAIAGAIVLPWIGMMLSLFGGPAKDSLLGATAGSAVALVYCSLRTGSINFFALNLCLLIGGMIGGNFAFFLAVRRKWQRVRIAAGH